MDRWKGRKKNMNMIHARKKQKLNHRENEKDTNYGGESLFFFLITCPTNNKNFSLIAAFS